MCVTMSVVLSQAMEKRNCPTMSVISAMLSIRVAISGIGTGA